MSPTTIKAALGASLLLVASSALALQAAGAPAVRAGRAAADVTALAAFGPRIGGSAAQEGASAYLVAEYRKAGYEADVRTFSYERFDDLGSRLSLAGQATDGRALQGSPAGTVTARLVAVPGFGRPADYAGLDARGAIAIVRRGELRFSEKATHAAAAGAAALVVVNQTPTDFGGALAAGATIPVLGLSGASGGPLLERAERERVEATIEVRTERRAVEGRNVVARLPGVERPRVLLGGHYDSVPGSPGANDNASGTAVVLEIARAAAGTPLARQAWFVAFDGEEDGLEGSQAMVAAAGREWLGNLSAMLNFDMVGVNDGLMVGGTESVVRAALASGARLTSFDSDGGSDHASFLSAGVPAAFFYRGQEPNYHLPTDRELASRLLDETADAGLKTLAALVASPAANR